MKTQDLENDDFKSFHSPLTMITIQIYIKYIYITLIFYETINNTQMYTLLDCIKHKCRDFYVLYITTVLAFGLVLLTHTLLVQTHTHDVSAPWTRVVGPRIDAAEDESLDEMYGGQYPPEFLVKHWFILQVLYSAHGAGERGKEFYRSIHVF